MPLERLVSNLVGVAEASLPKSLPMKKGADASSAPLNGVVEESSRLFHFQQLDLKDGCRVRWDLARDFAASKPEFGRYDHDPCSALAHAEEPLLDSGQELADLLLKRLIQRVRVLELRSVDQARTVVNDDRLSYDWGGRRVRPQNLRT